MAGKRYQSEDASGATLVEIPVEQIHRNPDNPRILFRQQEMDELLDSIKKRGVLVPISVYRNGKTFTLIDGERRWRCCLKLNRKTIPALVQDKPNPLDNILLMFNIHALREQWDLLTIALKLKEVIELLANRLGRKPTERDVAAQTGLKIGVIRRCKYLLDLPPKYHEMILKELAKPKSQQKLTEDFFIEMERALTTVQNAMPDVLIERDKVRRTLITKFRKGVIDNRVAFRKVAKIARAKNVGADTERAHDVLDKLFMSNDYSIEDAYGDSVSEAYSERDLDTRLKSLIERLRGMDSGDLDSETRVYLEQCIAEARRLLGGER